jgi:hypothetical protein
MAAADGRASFCSFQELTVVEFGFIGDDMGVRARGRH